MHGLEVAIIIIIITTVIITEVRLCKMELSKSEIRKNKENKIHFYEDDSGLLCLTTIFSSSLPLSHVLCLNPFLIFPFQHSFYD